MNVITLMLAIAIGSLVFDFIGEMFVTKTKRFNKDRS